MYQEIEETLLIFKYSVGLIWAALVIIGGL